MLFGVSMLSVFRIIAVVVILFPIVIIIKGAMEKDLDLGIKGMALFFAVILAIGLIARLAKYMWN